MRPRLRLFAGDETETLTEPLVSIRLGEVIGVLEDAVRWDRTWLRDFKNDEIQIPADLYEVLTAYSHLRPSA